MEKKLYQIRATRISPSRDEKVLASWNGLMSSAFCKIYLATGQVEFLKAAQKNLEFIWINMQKDGRLWATWKDGRARHHGTLEDMANVAQAYFDFAMAAANPEALQRSEILLTSALQHFDDPDHSMFYTADDAEKLVVRSKNPYDSAVPAANSTMVGLLYRFATLKASESYRNKADQIVADYALLLERSPRSCARLLRERCLEEAGRTEWVLVHADKILSERVRRHMKPGDVFVDESFKGSPLLESRLSGTEPTLYICTQQTCQAPLIGKNAILAALGD